MPRPETTSVRAPRDSASCRCRLTLSSAASDKAAPRTETAHHSAESASARRRAAHTNLSERGLGPTATSRRSLTGQGPAIERLFM